MGFWSSVSKGVTGALGGIGKTAGTILGGASGVSASNAGAEGRKYGERSEKVAGEELKRGNAQQDVASRGYGDLAASGKQYGAGYDQAVQQSLAQTPEQYLAAQSGAAEAQAAKEAQASTNQATRAALKAGRTGGMMGGQAALAAAQNAGNVYAGAKQSAMDASKANYAQANTQRMQGLQGQASEMANRQAAGAQGQAGLAGQSIGAAQSYQGAAGSGFGTNVQGQAAAGQNANGVLGGAAGMIGGVAGLLSDIRMKEDIQPASLADTLAKLKGFSFKYRGSDRPEVGIMAQDLEGTALDPAVIDNPNGLKSIDAGRLTTANTAALSEHEKRLRDIEALVGDLAKMGVSACAM